MREINETKEKKKKTYRNMWWQRRQKSKCKSNSQAKAEMAKKEGNRSKKMGVKPVYIGRWPQ
jgi:hypothetical protein